MIFFRSSGMPHALRMVWITFHHLGLSACCLDSLLGRSGESRSLDSELLGQLAAAQNLVAVAALGEDTLLQQRVDRDSIAVLELIQGAEIHDLQGLCEDVVEAALGDAAGQRHLAAFKANTDLAAGAGLLALVTAAAGLSVAGAGAPALPVRGPDGAFSGRQFAQFHNSVLLTSLP